MQTRRGSGGATGFGHTRGAAGDGAISTLGERRSTVIIAHAEEWSNGERSAWRDAAYSQRHREWPKSLGCCDVDSVEFNMDGEPVAVFEMKRGLSYILRDTASHRAVCRLADRAQLPFFFVLYTDRPSWAFLVLPGNERAEAILATEQAMDEQAYVRFLQRLRREARR